ncbi:MAG TPA: bifunctional hydroxymethylpyrimidine kinase/phosphomethylpyrimidine kinase, partial [Armatimonadota bacterium]|nr:bifunctional hydroxymethylpyrimidine kinase/phosphomethylpyrimidine kinase [Armatimonadota bacterium]
MTTALTIAGSDPTGGAGIQADLQTFASLGVHGAAAVTALTVQDTRAVHACQPLASEQVAEQLRALLADVCVAAAKTGMLAGADTVHVVARHLTESSTIPLVVDPVTVSTSGRALLTPEGVDALRD